MKKVIQPPLEAIFFHEFKRSFIPHILKEIYIDGIYFPFLIGKRDLIIADWGANIGLTAYYFRDYAKTVYAVEPSKEHREALERMIEFNKITNIKVCPYAISNKNEKEAKLYHIKNNTNFSLKEEINIIGEHETVETVTADKFLQREGIYNVDLLKFDVEGMENEIIASKEFQLVCESFPTIIGEWHDWASTNQMLFENMFRSLGYTFKWINSQGSYMFMAQRI